MTLQALTTGSATNYPMTVNVSDQNDYPFFTSGSALTGGTDGGWTPDAGTINLSVNGLVMSVPWQSGTDAPTLAYLINQQLGNPSFLTVNYSAGATTLGLTSAQPGSATNWPITCSATDAYGQPASFTVSCPGMSGGTNSNPLTYQYAIPSSGGYAANGDLLTVTDSVMGTWSYQYDHLNRLITAQASANPGTTFAPYGAALLSWGYDSFGNYQGETLSGNTSFSLPQVNYTYMGQSYQNGAISGAINNRIDGVNYDAAGNVITDIQGNNYTYDAENRVLATGGTSYIYDAEGNRVVKLSAGSVTNQYLLGLGGEQVAEIDGNGAWLRTYVYGAGKQLAKYEPGGVHFDFTDWLGTRRMQGGAASGTIEETCQSLPYGDSLQCFGASGQPNGDQYGHHFTGKERDTESGLDYFGARYYASNMGRWMSPDWAAKPEAVPYSSLGNPQTLNLYGYVGNNPLSRGDADGHHAMNINISDQTIMEAEAGAQQATYDKSPAGQADAAKAAAQQQSSSGGGFWSHVSNLFHGHSWNYGMRERVTVTISPAEPNSNVDLATSAAGLLSATPGAVPGAPGLMLGLAAGVMSSVNDPSGLNLTINGTGGALGAVSYFAEGTAVGTGATVGGFGVAAAATAWSVSNWISTNIITPVFTPDANQSNTINANGVTIQAPDAFDWSQP